VKPPQGTDEPGLKAVWRNSGRAHAIGRAAIPVTGTSDQLRLLSEALPEGSWIDGNEIVLVGEGELFLERRAAVGAAIERLNRRGGSAPEQPR
jgi:hypothetical protein